MHIYFVRHGETDFNAQQLHQHQEVALSERGLLQAKSIAKRICQYPIERIIASPFLRTKQTAEVIQKETNLPLEYNQVFTELRSPSEVHGKHHSDPIVQQFREMRSQHVGDPSWHYSDEENFYDMAARAKQALTFLTQQPEKHILVVTHGGIMRMMLSVMLMGDTLTQPMSLQIASFLYLTNTAMAECGWDGEKWHLDTWNDRAHLTGDLKTW